MDDHNCQGWSCRCMDKAAYKPRKNSRLAFSGTIPGSKGERGIGTRSHPVDAPLSPEGEAYKARLERETTISLRDFPERWRVQKVTETKNHTLTAYEERRRQGRS